MKTMMRFEYKYVLTKEQLSFLKNAIKGHLKIDNYGRTSIASLYYDTPDFRLIRTSIDKPAFKEKVRVRCYGLASETNPVFLEIKRKYQKVVYKRRIVTSEEVAEKFFKREIDSIDNSQISKEISYFRDYYKKLIPVCVIIYDREAYYDDSNRIRLTIDENPRYRITDLNLHTSFNGIPILPFDGAVMEIKSQGSMPLWLTSILDTGKMFKTPFSKVGQAYIKHSSENKLRG